MEKEMIEELKTQMAMVYEIMGDPNLAKSIAKMMKNITAELIAVGFSREQSIQIATKIKMNLNAK